MMAIFAATAHLKSGWARNVRLTVERGKIASITTDTSAAPDDTRVDTLLPALANLHSHAFQRAMAGMTEFRAAGRDSFWTWRELMYRFLDRLTPRHVEAIASLVFMEMQEAGYASVGEFHYVHNQPDGQQYDDPAELSKRVFAAAGRTGIGLTHLPVLYTYGGAGQQALAGGQLRFGNDVDRFNDLVDRAKSAVGDVSDDAQVGIAPHSLRATSPADLAQVIAGHPAGPIHIHISEQVKEVEDINAWLGARPVEWLLDNADVTDRWCLIHATHMTADETVAMARSGAVAGLCPITEANLGDGPFNGPTYLEHGGAFGLGSDSNVRISLTEELRTLEYSQRLRDMARNVMVDGAGSVGAALYLGAAKGGAQALKRDAGAVQVGALADLVAIERNDPTLCALAGDQILDGLCFAASDRVVTDLWSAGRHCVQAGQHVNHDEIAGTYRAAMADLLSTV
ncbi:MAG: formimidoylglutamate deiminase [Rhodobacteraceae bacterium]|nr:formimidoylglutamate deiminase [Paracoccaceae bacterium]